jgi:lipopolysaccharide/colanic/teichoic acid biosynthesis glycosyltransferase
MPKQISISVWLLALPAILLCYLSLMIVINVRYPAGLSPDELQLHVIHFSVIYVLWMVVLFMHNIFEREVLQQTRKIIFSLVSAMVINLVIAVAYFYFQPDLILTPRRFLLGHVGLTFIFLITWCLLIRQVLARRLTEVLYLYNHGQDLQEFVAEIKQRPFLGWRLADVISEIDLSTLSGKQSPIGLVIPDSRDLPSTILQKFYALRLEQVKFYRYQDLYESVTRKVYLPTLSELWFLENIKYQEGQAYKLAKRIIDLLAGVVALAVLLVLYPLIALVIKLDSPGPVLFSQARVGKYGTIFKVHKFRTMRQGSGNTWTAEQDSRITGVGKVLRRLRIDEWPQAVNLLKGEMSLVGPRPEQPHIVAQLRPEIPFYDERHLVKPGLTGWGQLNVYARTVEQTKTKLQYDLYYIKHRSWLFDGEIILKTLYHIFTSSEV